MKYALLIWLCASPWEPACYWKLAGVYRDEVSCVANGMIYDLEPIPRFKCEAVPLVPLPRQRPR